MTHLPALLPSVPKALAALDRLAEDVRNAPTLQSLKMIAAEAAAYQRAFRSVKEVGDRAGVVQIDADVKLADELDAVGKNEGTRGNLRGKPKGHGSSGNAILAAPDERPTLLQMDVDPKWAARAHKLKALGDELRWQYIDELKAEDNDITPRTVLAKDRAARKEQVKQRIVQAAFSEDGPFGTVIIDPPWDMAKIDREVRPNQAEFDYPVMSEEEIVTFWRGEMAPRLEPDCHLFMWTTQKHLPTALRIIYAIDFRYVLTMVWHKTGGFQPIGLPQYNCEFAVYARIGAPMFIDTKDFFCCFEAERREHSRKPDAFYDTIRRVTGGSRIDVFSREQRDGFAQYGNEPDRFANVA